LLTAALAASAVGVWAVLRPASPQTPSITTTDLHECLGLPAGEVVQRLRLGEAEWFWSEEPPFILRGVSYFPADGQRVTLYIAEGEPLFRQFSEHGEWDYETFQRCRVGGIQYKAGDTHLNIGPAVPWQFR
jgi:hypothetical protein